MSTQWRLGRFLEAELTVRLPAMNSKRGLSQTDPDCVRTTLGDDANEIGEKPEGAEIILRNRSEIKAFLPHSS